MENKPKTRLVKGSEEAQSHMANLRSKRGANKQPVDTPPPTPTPTQPIEIPTQKPKSRKNFNVDFP